MSLFQQPQQTPPPTPPTQTTSLPPQIGNIFTSSPSTLQHPPSSFSTQQQPKTLPDFAAEILGRISVAPPSSTTTGNTSAYLTEEEWRRLYEQQTTNFPSPDQPTTVIITHPPETFNVAPFAGFIPPTTQYESSEEPLRSYMQTYVNILKNVARALGEVLRIVRGEPALDTSVGSQE